MSADDQMDERLQAAGERWRERNAEQTQVDFTSLIPGAEPAAGAAAGSVSALDEPVESPRVARRQHAWQWVFAVAAVAVILVGMLSVTSGQDKGTKGGGASATNSAAATESAERGSPLYGSWNLTGWSTDGKILHSVARTASIRISSDGTLGGNDGCNSFSGTAETSLATPQTVPTVSPAVARSEVAGKPEQAAGSKEPSWTGTIAFSRLSATAMDCAGDDGLTAQIDAFARVTAGVASWHIYQAGGMALYRDNAVLVFDPSPTPMPTVVHPSDSSATPGGTSMPVPCSGESRLCSASPNPGGT